MPEIFKLTKRQLAYRDKFPLTMHQREILELLREKNKTLGYVPSLRAMAEELGIKDSSLHKVTRQLDRKGFIGKTTSGSIFIPPSHDQTGNGETSQ